MRDLRDLVAQDLRQVLPELDVEAVVQELTGINESRFEDFWMSLVDPATTFALLRLIRDGGTDPEVLPSNNRVISDRLALTQCGYIVGRIALGTARVRVAYSDLDPTAFAGINSQLAATDLREQHPEAFERAQSIRHAATGVYWDGPLGDLNGFGTFLAGLALELRGTMQTELAYVFVCFGVISAFAEARLL